MDTVRIHFQDIAGLCDHPALQAFLDCTAAALRSDDGRYSVTDPEQRPARLRARLEPEGELVSGPPAPNDELFGKATMIVMLVAENYEGAIGRSPTVSELLGVLAQALGESPQDWFSGVDGRGVVAIEGVD